MKWIEREHVVTVMLQPPTLIHERREGERRGMRRRMSDVLIQSPPRPSYLHFRSSQRTVPYLSCPEKCGYLPVSPHPSPTCRASSALPFRTLTRACPPLLLSGVGPCGHGCRRPHHPRGVHVGHGYVHVFLLLLALVGPAVSHLLFVSPSTVQKTPRISATSPAC